MRKSKMAICVSFLVVLLGCGATNQGDIMVNKALILNSFEQEFLVKDFSIVKNRNEIRKEIISTLSGKSAPIANPGEKYNETDFIDLQYPTKMIVFAGSSNGISFVHYLQGGLAPHSALYLVKYEGNKAIFECSYSIPKANNLDELKILFQTEARKDNGSCK